MAVDPRATYEAIDAALAAQPSDADRAMLMAALLTEGFMPVDDAGRSATEQSIDRLFQLVALATKYRDSAPLGTLLSMLSAYAADAAAARPHVVAHLRGVLPVLRAATGDDERERAAQLVLALLEEKTADGKRVFDVGDFLYSFLTMFQTMRDEQRAVTLLAALLTKLWEIRCPKATAVARDLVRRLATLAEPASASAPRRDRAALQVLSIWVGATPTFTNATMDAVRSAGLVPVCVATLRKAVAARESDIGELNEGVLEDAVAILNRIVALDRGSEVILRHGVLDALDALIALFLLNPSARLRGLLTEALTRFCERDAPARATVGASGCLEVCADMLRGGSSTEKTAAALALAAICNDHNENVKRLPLVDVLDLCAPMLEVEATSAQATAALRVVRDVACEPAAWSSVAAHPKIIGHVLRLLEHGRGSTQVEATLAVTSLMNDQCRPQLIDGNLEQLLDAIEDERVRPFAQRSLRTWRMALYTLEAERDLTDEPRDIDGFCIVAPGDCTPDGVGISKIRSLESDIGELIAHFFFVAQDDPSKALIGAADNICDLRLTAADIVRFGIAEVIFGVVEAVLAAPSSAGKFVTQINKAAANSSTKAGLAELFRDALTLIESPENLKPQSTIAALSILANGPRLGVLLLQVGVVDTIGNILSRISTGEELVIHCCTFVCTLARLPVRPLLLESGVVDLVFQFHQVLCGSDVEIVSAVRRELHTNFVLLARDLRAVQVLALASPKCVAVQAELSLLPDYLAPKEAQREDSCVAVGDASTMDSFQCDTASKTREIRNIVRLIDNPEEQTFVLTAEMEEKVKQAEASSHNPLRAWAHAARFLQKSFAVGTVEFAVMTYLEGGEANMTKALRLLSSIEVGSTSAAETANVFAISVATLQFSKDNQSKGLARQLLLGLNHEGRMTDHLAGLQSAQLRRLANALCADADIEGQSLQVEVVELLGILAEAQGDAKLLAGARLLSLMEAVRNGSTNGDERMRLAAASTLTAVLEGRLSRSFQGDTRALVVAVRAGLVQAFIALFSTAKDADAAASVMTKLATKLTVMASAKAEYSTPARACLVALLRALLSLARSQTGERFRLAIELVIRWTKASPGELVRALVDAGAMTVVSTMLSQFVAGEQQALGAVQLHHVLELVGLISTLDEQRRQLTQGDNCVMEMLKTLLSCVARMPELRGAIEETLSGLEK